MNPYRKFLASVEQAGISTFQSDLENHLRHGVVMACPQYFLMARSVDLGWPLEKMRDSSLVDPSGQCWFVWACCGEWQSAAHDGILTYGFKPYLAFERRGCPRLIETSVLTAKLLH